MQLTETVTIINKSGKIIGNGKHIVNIFKEAKAAYQDKKASIKAERAAAAEIRPGIKKAQTYAGPAPSQYSYAQDQVYDLPDRRHFVDEASYYAREPQYLDDGDRRRSIDDAGAEARSVASSRRSHATSHRSHRSHRSRRTTAHDDGGGGDARSILPPPTAPLTASNLRTHSEVSSTAPSQITAVYRPPYAETAPRDSMVMSRPNLARAATAAAPSTMVTMEPALVPHQGARPGMHHAMSESDLSTIRPGPPADDSSSSRSKKKKKKKEIDMNLAYGNIPPDLASRTDLGPVTRAEEERAQAEAELKREQEARTLMARIDTILDEAEAVQHTAASIIDHLQRKPEAAAAVALMLAELSTLLKALGPGFLAVVKGGSPAIFALLASPQFLIGAGVAVGVTVVCFGGWKIVKRIKEAKAIAAEREAGAQAFEMHEGGQYYHHHDHQQQQYHAPSRYGGGEGDEGEGDDALVLEEELSTIETWRRGIVPSEVDDEELARSVAESADLELITPDAARSVRDDGRSIRTVRTHRSSRSHRSSHHHHHSSSSSSHHSRRQPEHDGGEEPDTPGRESISSSSSSSRSRAASRAATAPPTPTDAASEAGSTRSRRTASSRPSRAPATPASEAGSERSRRTARSRATTADTVWPGPGAAPLKALEDGSRQAEEDSLASVLGSKRPSMLKTLFRKKKDREDAALGRESAAVSVVA